MKLLVERGYDRATTGALAAAAGMHEATLFRKYGSKAGLIAQAITHQLSTTPLSRVTYSGDLRADLLGILRAYQATVAAHGEIMPVLLVEIQRYPELKASLQAPLANIRGVGRIIARYQEAGLLKKEPTMLTINALIGPLMVNAMYGRVDEEPPPPDLNLSAYLDSFLAGRQAGEQKTGERCV